MEWFKFETVGGDAVLLKLDSTLFDSKKHMEMIRDLF